VYEDGDAVFGLEAVYVVLASTLYGHSDQNQTRMEQEFAEIHSWSLLFRQICNESRNHDFTAVEALKAENKQLNRYRDVYPYDHSRVPLVNVSTTDYINASLVVADSVSRSYILTQGPLPGTVSHFWSMVWEQQSKAIIMLNRVMENGTLKCEQYWPGLQGDLVKYDVAGLTVENMVTQPGDHYNVSTLRISHLESGQTRDVSHFHYTTWPDFGVPTCPDTFLQFLGAVRKSGSLASSVGPAIIHCSAGIGRSGTFVLVDTCLLEAETKGTQAVNVKARLLDMRTYRMGLIQTGDQLKFSYISIMEGARQLGLVDSVPQYETPVVEASDSESEEDVPPPLPPPRTESLKKEVEVVALGQTNVLVTDAEPYNPAQPHNELPGKLESLLNGDGDTEEMMTSSSVSGSGGESGSSSGGSNAMCTPADQSPNKIILTEHKLEERKREMEIKRRKKKEETTSTESKIAEMKKEIQRAEEWGRKREYLRQTLLPFCVGLLICAAGYYNMRSS